MKAGLIWKESDRSLGHWNRPSLVAKTVELAKNPCGVGFIGPSAPSAKLNALARSCRSICGSNNANQGVFWHPEKMAFRQPDSFCFQIRPGGMALWMSW